MTNPEIGNNDSIQIPVFNPIYKDATLVFDGADTWAKGTIMALRKIAAGAVAADGGNTGNGTVTGLALAPGTPPIAGAWNLEATSAGEAGRVAGAITPGSNTGNGTVTSLVVATGETPKVGDFELECTNADEGGAATGANVFTGTGNGTSSAIVAGSEAIEGDYIILCTDATVSGSEIFSVTDPNGVTLDPLTVGVAYSNNHIGLTLTDGGTDFIVGDYWTCTITIADGGLFKLTDPDGTVIESSIELPGTPAGTVAVVSGGIGFTLTDGATDFAVGDSFTMAIAAADGGTFKLEDPNGNLVASDIVMSGVALGATTFIRAGITFIITDGSTDFATADKFSLTITAVNKWKYYDSSAVDGSEIPSAILPRAETATGAGDLLRRLLIGGEVNESELVFDQGETMTESIRQQLRSFMIISDTSRTIDELDNQ